MVVELEEAAVEVAAAAEDEAVLDEDWTADDAFETTDEADDLWTLDEVAWVDEAIDVCEAKAEAEREMWVEDWEAWAGDEDEVEEEAHEEDLTTLRSRRRGATERPA